MPDLADLMLDTLTTLLQRRGHPAHQARHLAAELMRRPPSQMAVASAATATRPAPAAR